MQPLHFTIYDSRLQKTLKAAAAARNLDAAIPLRSAETELLNTIELRTAATQIAAPKPDPDAQAEKRRFRSTFEKEFSKEHHQHQNEKMLPKHHSQLSCCHYNAITALSWKTQ